MRDFFSRRPVVAALGVWIVNFAIQSAGALAFQAVAPQVSELIQRLILVLLLCALTVVLTSALGYWREAGYVGFSRWRQLGLIWLPLALTPLPLIGGFQSLDIGTLIIFITGYLATGFFEETIFRGVLLGFLRPLGIGKAVAISSVLFATGHLTRLLFGSAPATVGWQILFTFCFGVAYCAMRLRMGTIWPLILLHALWDLLLNTGHLPMMLYPVEHLALLGYGIFLLRRGATLADAATLPMQAASETISVQGQ